MRTLILTTAIVSSLVLAGCGGDDDDASPATTAAAATTAATAATTATESANDPYCTELETAAGADEDPGFDQFFTDHPEPTLDDWAAFLPGPIGMLTASIDGIAALDPPAELAASHDAVVDAMTAVRDSLQAGLDAAEAGDQAAFDANGQAPGAAMEAAIATLGAACGIEG